MLNLIVINQVIDNWRKDGIKLLPPCNEAEIISVFAKMNQKLSADIIKLYCAVGGMDDNVMDSKCFSFWSIDKMIRERTAYNCSGVAFGDFLIESHAYYFNYEDANISSIYTDWSEGGELIKIADSVNDFFKIYLSNSEELGLF